MISKNILTTIIGFLFGYLLYSVIDSSTMFIFLFGGIGYFIGLILDNADRRLQIDKFHFSNIASSHEVFYSDILPEAVIIYSMFDNITTVLLDYKIDAKPEDYRLSVLKNLQEFDFRVIEDSSKTIFSLNIEFPEFNYSTITISETELDKFFYDIREQSIDFQRAVQKIIPGLVLSTIERPDIFGDQNRRVSDTDNFPHSSFPPDSPNGSRKLYSIPEKEDKLSSNSTERIEEPKTSEIKTETENDIISDLFSSRSTAQIISESVNQTMSEITDSDIKKHPNLLTANKIKERSKAIFPLQEEEEVDVLPQKESENEYQPTKLDLENRSSSIEIKNNVKSEKSFDALEDATIHENDKPLLAKIVEQIDFVNSERKSNIESEFNENIKLKESSKQET
ncbi:MAG: DUF2273 domain-containing protein [Candidatus Hodarchaeales archaeon]|jgi:hypothetical protein